MDRGYEPALGCVNFSATGAETFIAGTLQSAQLAPIVEGGCGRNSRANLFWNKLMGRTAADGLGVRA